MLIHHFHQHTSEDQHAKRQVLHCGMTGLASPHTHTHTHTPHCEDESDGCVSKRKGLLCDPFPLSLAPLLPSLYRAQVQADTRRTRKGEFADGHVAVKGWQKAALTPLALMTWLCMSFWGLATSGGSGGATTRCYTVHFGTLAIAGLQSPGLRPADGRRDSCSNPMRQRSVSRSGRGSICPQ